FFGGTLAYMAPEHLDAFGSDDQGLIRKVDVRSDIYALGLVLYELATGKHPSPVPRDPIVDRSELVGRVTMERRAGAPTPRTLHSGLPSALEAVLCRCLEPDPADRYG